MKIGLDLDGVFADFNTAFVERVVKVTGTDLFGPRPVKIETWDYPTEQFGYTSEQEKKTWEDVWADGSFWYTLPEYPGATRVIGAFNNLQYEGHDVYFITNRKGKMARLQSVDWLIQRGMRSPAVFTASDKGGTARVLGLDCCIDDRWENAVDVALSSSARSYVLVRGWNREKSIHRHGLGPEHKDVSIQTVHSLDEFMRAEELV